MNQRKAAGTAVLLACILLIAANLRAPFTALPPLLGVGTGATIILGLAFIGLRTISAQQAAALSGMSQCFGYLLAATGPAVSARQPQD